MIQALATILLPAAALALVGWAAGAAAAQEASRRRQGEE